MKKLTLIALSAVFGLASAAGFAATAKPATAVKVAASAPAASAPAPAAKHHHKHKHHHHHAKKAAMKPAASAAQ